MPLKGHGFREYIERGKTIRSVLVEETQANNQITRQQLLAKVAEHGIPLTLARLNTHLRNLGIMQVICWSQPGAGSRTKRPTRKVQTIRDILANAVTNGHKHSGTADLSKYLLEEHQLPIHTENLRRHLSALGFHWLPSAEGMGWDRMPGQQTQNKPVVSTPGVPLPESVIKERKRRAEYMSDYVRNRRQNWIDEHGPCKCGSSVNLIVYTGGQRKRLFWTLSDTRLAPMLAKSEVMCKVCHDARRNAERAGKDGLAALQLRASREGWRNMIAETRQAEKLELARRQQAEREAADAAWRMELLQREQARMERRNQKRAEAQQRKLEKMQAKRRERIEKLLSSWAWKWFDSIKGTLPRPERTIREEAIGRMIQMFPNRPVHRIREKHVRQYRHALTPLNQRVATLSMNTLKTILITAGVWQDSWRIRPIRRGRNLNGKAFLRSWLKARPCERCGGKSSKRVLSRKDGQRVMGGLSNMIVPSIERYLTECDAVCQRCKGFAAHGRNESDLDAIRDAIQSFQGIKQIVTAFRSDRKTVLRLAQELHSSGVSCLCGEPLLHHGTCELLKLLRDNAQTHVNEPKPVRSTTTALRDSSLCSERPCPFHVHRDGLCLKHWREFQMAESFTDRTLDMDDYIAHPDHPEPTLSNVRACDLANPWLVMEKRA